MGLHELNGIRGAPRLQDRVSSQLQKLARHATHRVIIFYYEDSFFVPKEANQRCRRVGGCFNRFFNSWKVDLKCRPRSGLAGDRDTTAALVYGAIYSCQAESRTPAFVLGGEERFKEVRLRGFVHAMAGIAHTQCHVGTAPNSG